MWSRSRRGISLAGQFLVLQLTVLLAVLAVSSVVSVQQADADFRDTRGARLRAAAENLAGTSAVRSGLAALRDRTDADELMVVSDMFDFRKRLRSFEIIASVCRGVATS